VRGVSYEEATASAPRGRVFTPESTTSDLYRQRGAARLLQFTAERKWARAAPNN